MPEWVDREHFSVARVAMLRLECSKAVPAGHWHVFVGPTELDAAPTREAAKSAAEAEARRVLLEGLRALGWPDDAAVERALRKYVGSGDESIAYFLEQRGNDMRAALTAAVEAPDGQ